MIRHHAWVARLGFVIYAVALGLLTHWPRLELTVDNNVVAGGFDKWGHVGAFGLWALLLLTTGWVHSGPGRAGRAALIGFAISAAYAVVDELTQALMPGRQFGADDVFASLIGCACGALVWRGAAWIDQPTQSFISHAKVMSALTLVSRCFGLARDIALARVLGFGWVGDAYAVAFMVPNLFRRLFGEGALAGAFVPHYTQLEKHDRAAAMRFASRVLHRLAQALLVLAAVGVAITLTLVLGGAVDERGKLMAGLTAVSLWYMPLVCLAAILGAMLQVHGKFAVPSASPILLNVFIIGACIIGAVLPIPGLTLAHRAYIVVGAVVLAGLAQVTWHGGSLRAAGVVLASDKARREVGDDPAVAAGAKRLLKQWLPTVLGLAVFQINTLMDAMIATFFSAPASAVGEGGAATFDLFGWTLDYPMQSGAVATLGAAARLYEFPLGVFGIAVATALFPALARAADDSDEFADLLRRGLRMVVFIGLPAAVGLVIIRLPATMALYAPGGQVQAGDAARVAWVLLGYAPAIWAYSMNHTLVRAFYAKQNPVTPMRVSVAMVALNLALNLSLIWLPIGGGARLGAAGLAWSTAVCAVVQCAALTWLLRRYVARPIDGEVMSSWWRTAAATAVMGIAVWGALQWVGAKPSTHVEAIIACAVCIVVGALVLAIAAWALRMNELRFVLRRGR